MVQVKIIQKESFELMENFNKRINEFLANMNSLGYDLVSIGYYESKSGYIESVVITYEVGGVKDVR